MIQDQNIQSQQQQVYGQVQVINTSDQPVCLTGLDNYLSNPNAQSIIIEQVQPYQYQDRTKQLKQKIILITSPTTKLVTTNNRVLETTPTKVYNLKSPRTRRILQVPFLPRRPTTTSVLKQNYPIKKVAVKTAQPEINSYTIPSAHLTQTPEANILIDEGFNPCSETVSQFQTFSTEKTLSSSKKKTLASMAGIQLTGSVETLPAAMSGAMPTATVEEINVPVFINEYLQQSTYIKPTSNGDDHSKSNKSKSSEGSENDDLCIEESIDHYIDSDIFENFEFDIDLIPTGGENTDSASNFNIQKEEQQKEIMFSNDCFNINYYNDDKDIEDFTMISFQNPIFDDAAAAVGKTEIKEEHEDWSNFNGNPLHCQFPTESEDMSLTPDFIDECSAISINCLTENAIDITPWTQENELSLSQIMTSSQNNPMFSGTAVINSQNLWNAEPIVPDINTDIHDVIKMEEEVGINIADCEYDHSRTESGAVKRMNTSVSNGTVMREKRRKLHLETSLCANEYNDDLNTPGVVDFVLDHMAQDKHFGMHFKNTNDIVSELLSCSNSSFQSAKADTNTSYTIASYDENDEQPSTPQSCISSSYTNQTLILTSPNSPALSTISTTTTHANSTAKSRRGRPPKLHSDRPDPTKLRHLSESDRKRLEDRAKNNEASRLSRLKNKKREELEIEEENRLNDSNMALRGEYTQLCKKEEKLKRLLETLLKAAQ